MSILGGRIRLASAAIVAAALVATACGSPAAKSASSSPTAAGGVQAAPGTRGGGRFRGLAPADQTAAAQGTPLAFGGRTPPPEVQTSIAEGTPFGFGNRTPPAAVQTAIAEGTPASELRRGAGLGGGGRALAAAASILGIDMAQLQTELAAPGASLEQVAAAHGFARATFKQDLIDAVHARLAQSVSDGTLTQQAADQAASDFDASVDSLLDRIGGLTQPEATPTP